MGVAANEREDGLRSAGDQIEHGRRQGRSGSQGKRQARGRLPRSVGLERSAGAGEQLRGVGQDRRDRDVIRVPEARASLIGWRKGGQPALRIHRRRVSFRVGRFDRPIGRERPQIREERPGGLERPARVDRPDGAARHAGEDRVEQALTRSKRPAGQPSSLAGPAEMGLHFGGDDECKHVLWLALEIRRRRIAGAREVARPPADLGEVADPLIVEAVPAGHGFRARHGRGPVSRGGDEVGRGRDRPPARRSPGSPAPRRSSCGQAQAALEAAGVAGRGDDGQPEALVAE